ncbi:hypothetical protein ATANTOWER_010063 [Ataeniobius toweri]|uniref:Uncharacterized protein n=1 Tax=Ataeniobius toweri TaxID=208326 RepID=A0ABU7AX11_9TELE|nr:hypothetical protein [Ataeniobius toweri]
MEPGTLVRWAQVFIICDLLRSFIRETQPALCCLSASPQWFPGNISLTGMVMVPKTDPGCPAPLSVTPL